jgi:hypothetical protein
VGDNYKYSPGNIFREVFDASSKSLKVNISNGSVETPSVMQISDGARAITGTQSGLKNALDVSVINNLELSITHLDDSIALGDGTGLITSSIFGSKRALDVNITAGDVGGEFTQAPSGTTVATYDTESVNSGETKIITEYVVPPGNQVYLQKVYVSGDSVGKFTIYRNSSVLLVIRLSQTTFYQPIDFATSTAFGIQTSPGDILKVEAQNVSPVSGIFDATIQTMNT